MSTAAAPPELARGPVAFNFPRELPLTWQQRLEEDA
jgi:hypothetical protein